MAFGIPDVDPALDPPLCDCGEYLPGPGEDCRFCGAHNPDPDEIADLRAEAAIARAEDDRMFGEEPW